MGEISLPLTKNGLAYIVDFNEVLDDFLNDYPLYFYPTTAQFYQYKEAVGLFRVLEENEVRRYILLYLGDYWNPKIENSMLNALPVYAKVIKELNDKKDVIVCKNGVLSLEDLKLRSFSRKYHATFGLDVPYDPKAVAETYDAFLVDIACGDKVLVDTLNELLGYILCSSIEAEKCIILCGSGANGKSTFLNLVTAFVGVENISNISVTEINAKSFARHFLADKRLNIIYEAESDMTISGLMKGAVKQIVTGDATSAEIKGGKVYSFIPKVKILAATNVFPKIDRIPDHATARRLLILPFNNHFSPDKARKNMLSLLLNEQAGILNRAIEGLLRLKNNGWKFSYEQKSQQHLRDMVCSEFPVFEFVEEKIVADTESRVTYQVLRNAFLKWCKQNGVTSLRSEREFASELKQSLAKLDIPYDKSKSGGERGISGIALK